MPGIAVVVNYKSSDAIDDLLASVTSDGLSAIVIVDNSEDHLDSENLSAVVASHPSLPIHLTSLGANVGFGRAVNAGVRFAQTLMPFDWIWILNPDVILQQGAQRRMISAHDMHSAAVLSPTIIVPSAKGSLVWWTGGTVDVARGRVSHFDFGRIAERVLAELDDIGPVSFVPGTAILVPSQIWTEVGGFDERLFLYWEDVEFSLRLQRRSVPMLRVSTAVVSHEEGIASRDHADSGHSSIYYYWNNRNRFVVTAPGLTLSLPRYLIATLTYLFRPVWTERSSRAKKVVASAAGLRAGIAQRLRGPLNA